MVKLLIFIALILSLSACGGNPIKVTTSTIEVKVPVISEQPPPPEIDRPVLPIHTIVNDDTDGEIAKKFNATVRILLDYSTNLEDIIETYKKSDK